jgi:hypothetical protein
MTMRTAILCRLIHLGTLYSCFFFLAGCGRDQNSSGFSKSWERERLYKEKVARLQALYQKAIYPMCSSNFVTKSWALYKTDSDLVSQLFNFESLPIDLA